MPLYEHICDECEHEWDDIYSWRDPVPTVCPECKTEGQVRRLISLPSEGKVELTGNELKAKLKSDAQKMKREMHSSEKTYANMLGDDKYQAMQSKIDKAKTERPKIKKSKKSA